MADAFIRVNNTKECELEFEVNIQGISVDDENGPQVRFVITNVLGGDLSFACERKADDNQKWTVTLPALTMLKPDQDAHTFRVEVIIDGYYFEPASGNLILLKNPDVQINKTGDKPKVSVITFNQPAEQGSGNEPAPEPVQLEEPVEKKEEKKEEPKKEEPKKEEKKVEKEEEEKTEEKKEEKKVEKNEEDEEEKDDKEEEKEEKKEVKEAIETGIYAPTNKLLSPEHDPAKPTPNKKPIDLKKIFSIGRPTPGDSPVQEVQPSPAPIKKKVKAEEKEDEFDAKEVAENIIKQNVGNISRPEHKGTLLTRSATGKVVVPGLVEEDAESIEIKKQRQAKAKEMLKGII